MWVFPTWNMKHGGILSMPDLNFILIFDQMMFLTTSSFLPHFCVLFLLFTEKHYFVVTHVKRCIYLSRDFGCGRKLGLLRTQDPCNCLFTLRGFSFMGHAWQEVQSQDRCASPWGPASAAQGAAPASGGGGGVRPAGQPPTQPATIALYMHVCLTALALKISR